MTVRKLDEKWIRNQGCAEILLIRIMTKHASRTIEGKYPSLSKVPGWEDMSASNTNVEFKINGVDVGEDLLATFNSLEEDINRMAEEKAREMVSDKIHEFTRKIEQATEKVTDAMDDVFCNIVQEHGLKKEDYEDEDY